MNRDHTGTPGQGPAMGFNRRSFLKAAGFTFAGAMLAGCDRRTAEKAIPYLVKPEEVTPGTATWYASTCGGCEAACGILIKNRDGRPIKIEGNPDHPLSGGGLCATGQAMVLSLYDSHRLRKPLLRGAEATWDAVDAAVTGHLAKTIREGRAVRVMTGSSPGPTALAAIGTFLSAFPDAKHITFDSLSASAISDAHEACYGRRFIPHYRFDRAKVIVSFDADFLGTWLSPVEYTRAYRAGRSIDGPSPVMSHHVQFESRMSLTGSNADRRVVSRPDEQYRHLLRLTALVDRAAGRMPVAPDPGPDPDRPALEEELAGLAATLAGHRGASLVVCGANHLPSQLLVAYLNEVLGNTGSGVDLSSDAACRTGNDRAAAELVSELESGRVGTLIVCDANPAYDWPGDRVFAGAMKKAGMSVVFATHANETSSEAAVVLPRAHPLEEWADSRPVTGIFSVRQPAIAPFGDSRSLTRCLYRWVGEEIGDLEAIRRHWRGAVFPSRNAPASDFDGFWNSAVYQGFVRTSVAVGPPKTFDGTALVRCGGADERKGDLILEVYPTVAILDGTQAHNPWLQELPDPVTKIVWDNYASLSPATAAERGLRQGDVVRISLAASTLELPVAIQPGQADGTVAVALGYGRMGTDRFTRVGPEWFEAVHTVEPGETVGRNAAPARVFRDGTIAGWDVIAGLAPTGNTRRLARTQEYDSLTMPEGLAPAGEGPRPIIQETTFAAYAASRSAGSFPKTEMFSIWPDEHQFPHHRWAMAIDLSACTGCSACVVGCQAENNVPVVGKDEVSRNREMTWLRIDRYYSEEDGGMRVAHQPMLCQHCEHAPCETVCPTLATVHNDEGLNQQVYNRCVGTRYCSNNCPYKVRRFNWFDYPRGDDTARLVLNPDVSVRERGIMEKCSFCVQRIQAAKISAKEAGRPVADGDVKTACEQSCPAQAIVFGDLRDPASRISKLQHNPRMFRVLEETGTAPSIAYMTLVRNDGGGHG